nr:F-box domain-containing protein [Tanacetum cinerariifolium]
MAPPTKEHHGLFETYLSKLEKARKHGKTGFMVSSIRGTTDNSVRKKWLNDLVIIELNFRLFKLETIIHVLSHERSDRQAKLKFTDEFSSMTSDLCDLLNSMFADLIEPADPDEDIAQLVRDTYVSCQHLMVRCEERHEQILKLQNLVGSTIVVESVRLLQKFLQDDLESSRGMMRLIRETQIKVQLLVVLERANIFQKNGIDPSKYTITFRLDDNVPKQEGVFGDYDVWVYILLYRLAHGLSLDVDDHVDVALTYREKMKPSTSSMDNSKRIDGSTENYSLFEVNYDGMFDERPLRYVYGRVLPLKLSNSNRMTYFELLDMLVYKLEGEFKLCFTTPKNTTLKTPPLKKRRKGIAFQGKIFYEDVYGGGCFDVSGSFKGFDCIEEPVGCDDGSLPVKIKDEFENELILDDVVSSPATLSMVLRRKVHCTMTHTTSMKIGSNADVAFTDTKQKVTAIQDVEDLQVRIENLKEIFSYLRNRKLKQKEVILGTDYETSSNDDTTLNDEISSSEDLINYLSARDVEWQLPKNTQEEPPKPHYDPIKTEVEEPLPLDIVYPHSHVASSVMGTNRTGRKGKEKVIEDEGICSKGNKADVTIYKRAMVNRKSKMVEDVGAVKRGMERGVVIEDDGFSNDGGKETVVTKRAIGSRKMEGKSVKVESE